MSLLPAAFQFRYAIPVQRVDKIPRDKAPLIKLPVDTEIPFPSAMDSATSFARLFAGWNPSGLALSVTVEGKQDWPDCSPDAMHRSDGVQLWIDTRDTQNIHRASRYCHHFCLLPVGEGDDGMQPCFGQFPISRASEDAPEIDPDSILLESVADETSYTVSVWFPSESLTGFDPEGYPHLGFYLAIQDRDHGKQVLTVGDDFPYQNDPSMWVSLTLQSDSDQSPVAQN